MHRHTQRIEMENGEHQIESKYVLLPSGVCSTYGGTKLCDNTITITIRFFFLFADWKSLPTEPEHWELMNHNSPECHQFKYHTKWFGSFFPLFSLNVRCQQEILLREWEREKKRNKLSVLLEGAKTNEITFEMKTLSLSRHRPFDALLSILCWY